MAKKRKKTNRKNDWGRALGLVLIIALIVKGFVFQSFMVTSPTMEKTLLPGDYILVSKLKPGARLPITLLSLPFFSSLYSDIIQIPYWRFPGLQNIKRNDIIVFNYPNQNDPPIDKRDVLVKRCVAFPGDTLTIENKKVFVNGDVMENPELAQYNFRLVTNGAKLNQEFLNKYDIHEGGMVADLGIYDFPLDTARLRLVKQEAKIKHVRELKHFPRENTQYVYPVGGKFTAFNKDYFGPLLVPYKGMKIPINARNVELYKEIITTHEKNIIETRNYKILINGIETDYYTLKQDYYFVLDDNRDNAKDSRYWGFLPESHIIGKAGFVWFSFDKNKKKVRWSRFFKSLNKE